jgi:hypothetical protein
METLNCRQQVTGSAQLRIFRSQSKTQDPIGIWHMNQERKYRLLVGCTLSWKYLRWIHKCLLDPGNPALELEGVFLHSECLEHRVCWHSSIRVACDDLISVMHFFEEKLVLARSCNVPRTARCVSRKWRFRKRSSSTTRSSWFTMRTVQLQDGKYSFTTISFSNTTKVEWVTIYAAI